MNLVSVIWVVVTVLIAVIFVAVFNPRASISMPAQTKQIVKEIIEKSTGIPYALKIIDKQKCKGREYMIENEVGILRRVHHPNVVLLVDEFDSQEKLFLVMELVTGKTVCKPVGCVCARARVCVCVCVRACVCVCVCV